MHKLRYEPFEHNRRESIERKRRSRSRSPRSFRQKSPSRRFRGNERSDRSNYGKRSNISGSRRSFNRSLSRERCRTSRERMYSPGGIGHVRDTFRRSVSTDRNRSREEMYHTKEHLTPLMAVSTAYYKETRIEPVHAENSTPYYQEPENDRYPQSPRAYARDSYLNNAPETYIYPIKNLHERTNYHDNVLELNCNNSLDIYSEQGKSRRSLSPVLSEPIIAPPPPSFHYASNESVIPKQFPPGSSKSYPRNEHQDNKLPDHFQNSDTCITIDDSPSEEKPTKFSWEAPNKLNYDIPIFHGQEPELIAKQWIENIDSIGLHKKWTGSDKKLQMAARLEGPARDWFLSQDSVNLTWPKMKTLFLSKFTNNSDIGFYSRLKEMMGRLKVEAETYSTYFTEKIDLLEKCGITDQKAVSCLIGGLQNETLKTTCFNGNFKTAEELFEFLVGEDKLAKNPLNKHHIEVFLHGAKLNAFNCNLSEQTTIRVQDAKTLHISYKKKPSFIKGYKGVTIGVLGSFRASIKIQAALVHTRIFVVPNSFQDFPIIVGEPVRAKVVFTQDENGIYFNPHRRPNFNGQNPNKF